MAAKTNLLHRVQTLIALVVEQPFVVDFAVGGTALLRTEKRNTRFQLPVCQAILY